MNPVHPSKSGFAGRSGASLSLPMVRTAYRLLLVALFFVLFTLTLTSAAHAQEPCPDSLQSQGSIDDLNDAAIATGFDDKIFNLNQIAGTTDSLFTLLTGCSLIHPGTNSATAGQGALAASSKLVASLYGAPPASGVIYFAQQLQKINPVQPVYAQAGIGYQALSPIQNVWQKFRDASYIGFVIAFVIIGFMIMFRAHISPQAVATVQDSVPRIVIALILVTFSYAIAGFMIDIMFLVLNIAINLLDLGTGSNVIFERSIFGVIFSGWREIFADVAKAIAAIIDELFANTFVISGLLALFGGGVVGLVIGIALLFVMFRVFFMLLMAYVMIIILTIFAPFFFLFQALPGQNGAMAWFKQMASNVSVFAVVGIMILLAALIGGIESISGAPAGTPSILCTDPDNCQTTKFPLLIDTGENGFSVDVIGKLIALGFIMITPGVAQMTKEMFQVKGPGFGPAAFAAAGAGGAVASSPARFAGRIGSGALQYRVSQSDFVKNIGQRTPPTRNVTKKAEPGGEPSGAT